MSPGDGNVFTIDDDVTDEAGTAVPGIPSGSWKLNVSGGGRVVLAAKGYFSNWMYVFGSTLEVNGVLGTPGAPLLPGVEVDSGGALTGVGSTIPVYVTNGTVQPGNSSSPFGTLTVAEYHAQSNASELVIVTDTLSSAVMNVQGDVSLDGIARIEFSAVPSIGTMVPLLTSAGSISGTFSGWETNLPDIYGQLVYATSGVQFQVLALDDIFHANFDFLP
jgi:hypothetical protein